MSENNKKTCPLRSAIPLDIIKRFAGTPTPRVATMARAKTTTKKAPSKAPSKAPNRVKLDYQRAAGILKMAADGTRLQILLMLDEEEKNVTAMCEALGTQSQPAVSHHLALLRAARLV